ncbi:hypothetical protein QVD17_06911 [Tagetes erecta]|uniref:Uncharacterized protein n=1 Tax=Tagetes erecta TaxID=13708 RepID=A0AAD8LF46_TARER|nr:hypothetical protein QVD17_06911 [Tagetes erecta]
MKHQPIQKLYDDLKLENHDGSLDLNTPLIIASKDTQATNFEDLDGSCELKETKVDVTKDLMEAIKDECLANLNNAKNGSEQLDSDLNEKTIDANEVEIDNKDFKKLNDFNKDSVDTNQVDSNRSVEIIYHGLMFSPYKLDLEREWSEEQAEK